PTSPSPSPSTYPVTFAPRGNNWWVSTDVLGGWPARVEVSVNGAPPRALNHLGWTGWGLSFYVETGSLVRFTAYAPDGKSATSGWYTWPDARLTSAPSLPAPGTFSATVHKHAANNWWVEVRVDATKTLASVEAVVNNGAPVALSATSYGTWAKSFYVPNGASVKFVVKATDGSVVTSPAMTWP
ncbi:MAG TPA: hypothetical protein VM889_14625, partial [Candidatus Thermoplasmatota archaeon]|nr:hypothetical protein [Candidatus Thermoplasmatota archaeon]